MHEMLNAGSRVTTFDRRGEEADWATRQTGLRASTDGRPTKDGTHEHDVRRPACRSGGSRAPVAVVTRAGRGTDDGPPTVAPMRETTLGGSDVRY